jgi:mannose-6-phosphate isomerase-like protein (cupin superfamily)
MNIYIANIEEETIKNSNYRKVEYTTHNSQLVFMTVRPGDEIGNEIHGVDQFIRVEFGEAQSILNNGEKTKVLTKNMAIIIPAGTWHNIKNNGDKDLKIYTIYSGPNHLKDTIQTTKADEIEDKWDGKTNLL